MFKFSAWWVGLSPKQAAAAMLHPADEAAPMPVASVKPAVDEAAEPLDLAALVGAEGWARLPAAVRRRFAAGHADVVYEGRMDLACSRLGRAYAVLARLFGSPLTSARTQGLPTRVRVQNDGHGGVVWERCFAAHPRVPARSSRSGSAGRLDPLGGRWRSRLGAHVVRSIKLRGAHGGLIERTDGGLAMNLDVFEDQGALVFQSRSYFFDLFGWRLPVPAWLTPGTCRVEHRDLGPGRFRFTLVMDHPRWGRCFEQTGVFIDPDGSVE